MYLTQALHRAVQQRHDDPAVIDGDTVYSWAEVLGRVARLAGALRARGVEVGDRVAYLGLNSGWFTDFYFASAWAGVVANPVNTRWSALEVEYSLSDSGTGVLIVGDGFTELAKELAERCPDLRLIIHATHGEPAAGFDSLEEIIAGGDPIDDLRRGDNQLAGLFYTGGTTGFPKGVMLSATNLITSALGSMAMGFINPGARFLHVAPMFHLADLAAWMAVSLTAGVHISVPAFDPAAVCAAIQTHRVTDTVMIPAMLQMLVDSGETANYDLSSLRHVAYGGAPITAAALARTRAALPGVTFAQAFGQTELSPITTLLTKADHDDGTRLRSAGRAAPHAEIGIVDDNDRPVPVGTVGEIVARGAHVMQGYWNKPDETAAALRGGWLHTGDGGYLDEDGYLYVVDRLKDMIISGGENVYSAEVENALAQHPAVQACAVVGVPDEVYGERVHAVVVLAPGGTASPEDLREHVKGLIAGYKAPRSVEFVPALPLSSTGKILKRELRDRYWKDQDRAIG